MFLLSLSASSVNSSNSVEELTQFLWNEFNREEAEVKNEFELKFELELKFKAPSQSFTKTKLVLSDEQKQTLLAWYGCKVVKSKEVADCDFNEFGEMKISGSYHFASYEFLKLVDANGTKTLFFHWEKGQKLNKALRNAMRWANVLVRYGAGTVPSEFRNKMATKAVIDNLFKGYQY